MQVHCSNAARVSPSSARAFQVDWRVGADWSLECIYTRAQVNMKVTPKRWHMQIGCTVLLLPAFQALGGWKLFHFQFSGFDYSDPGETKGFPKFWQERYRAANPKQARRTLPQTFLSLRLPMVRCTGPNLVPQVRVCYFDCLKGFPKTVQVRSNGIETLMVLALIILKWRALAYSW